MSQIELELLTPGEVAREFHVDPKTVSRWGKSGRYKFLSIRTPGGHRRFFRLQIDAIRQGRKLTDAQLEILRQAGGRES